MQIIVQAHIDHALLTTTAYLKVKPLCNSISFHDSKSIEFAVYYCNREHKRNVRHKELEIHCYIEKYILTAFKLSGCNAQGGEDGNGSQLHY